MKDVLSMLKDWAIKPIVYAAGVAFITLLALSRIPELSFYTKFVLLTILTH